MKYLNWVTSAGVPVDWDSGTKLTSMTNGTTYYAELGLNLAQWAGLMSLHVDADAQLDGTLTIDASNYYDADLYSATAAEWLDVSSIPDVVFASSATQSIGSWADTGYGRLRAKFVCTGNGKLRGAFHVKKAGAN
jgi:hypothetical protein